MYKRTGYNPDHNDWFWLKVLADGTVEKEGMVMGCQECHGDVKDNDYIWDRPPGIGACLSHPRILRTAVWWAVRHAPQKRRASPDLFWSPAQPDTSAG